MRYTSLFSVFLFSILSKSSAQNWQALGSGADREVRILYSDSIHNLLYVGGSFISMNGINCRAIASWDGLQFDSLGSGIDKFNSSFPSPVTCISSISSDLYAGGYFRTAGGVVTGPIAKWNGVSWDSLPMMINSGIVRGMYSTDSVLYIGGDFRGFGMVSSIDLAKWDRTSWTGFATGIDTFGPGIFAIQEFDHKLFYGGGFHGSMNFINNLGYMDSTGFHDAGLLGSNSNINSMAVYNNELYIGGYFLISDGNAGNYIMKWDGGSWQDVGGGMDNDVWCLKVFNGYLYAGGCFTQAGGISASSIARWDGISWSALGPEIFNSCISSIAFYHNELYVGGGFGRIDTLHANSIAKYSGSLSVGKIPSGIKLSVYPNPAQSILYVKSENVKIKKCSIENMLGREEYFQNMSATEININLRNFAPGIYFLFLETEQGAIVRKFLRE